MSIEYHCDNCGKRFKPREYMKLEITYTSDDRSTEILVPLGRKCDSCGKEIKIEDKIVKA
jgi:glutamine synthetase